MRGEKARFDGGLDTGLQFGMMHEKKSISWFRKIAGEDAIYYIVCSTLDEENVTKLGTYTGFPSRRKASEDLSI